MALACVVASAQAEDWPQWRGPRGDGTWHGPPLKPEWPAERLAAEWQVPIGGGYGGISVVGQRLYVQDRQKEPQEVERIRCYDAGAGTLLWSIEYPVAYGNLDYGNGPRGTPTVHEGKVYTLGTVGHVYCLDAESGKVLWWKDCVKDLGAVIPTWGLAASPVIHQELVIVHPGLKEKGCFLALDRLTGKEVWRASADPAGYCTPIVIDSPSGPQLVGWTPEHILGMSPATGEINWSIPYSVQYGVSIATPIYHDNVVFVTGYWEGSRAIKLGAAKTDARLLWSENRWLRGLMSQPLYRDKHVYSLDKQHGLVSFELATGKKLWDDDNRMTPRGRNPQANLVWLDAAETDRALILNSDGDLILARLNPEGYHEVARANIIGPTWAHPAFAGKFVFARTDTELVKVALPTVE